MSQSCQLVQIATCCHEQTSRARPLHVFCLVSSPPYCMMEPSVAMVTGVANSNSTVEIGLLVALGCCWSRVGMKKGIDPPVLFFFGLLFLESLIPPSCLFLMSYCSETDWKHSHHLLSQATSTSPVSSQPLVKDPQSDMTVENIIINDATLGLTVLKLF